jgi:hypothetical protein
MGAIFGRHARARMAVRRITPEMVAAVMAAPRQVEPSRGETVRYYGSADGRDIIVVVAHDREPPFVITVMNDRPGGTGGRA